MIRDTLIIAAREIRDKRLLFLGAGLCAILVLATPLLPGLRGEDPVEVMTTAALAIALVVLLITTLALGMGVIGRDLEEQRMSFYLARPVNTVSIWTGKTLGALSIAFGTAAIVTLVPTLLGKGLLSAGNYAENIREGSLGVLMSAPFTYFPVLALFLFALAQFWGLGLRSRSAWLLLDLGIFAATGFVFWAGVRPYLLNGATPTALSLTVAFVTLLTLLIMLGNAIGLHMGRSDLHRNHQWTSISTGLLLAAGTLTFGLYSHVDRSVAPDELDYSTVVSAPRSGDWIAIAGARTPEWNAYHTTHLLNLRTNESIEIPNSAVMISDDGTVAAIWTKETISPPTARLSWIDLENSREIQRTDVVIPLEDRNAWGFVRWRESQISPGGGRVAWIEDGTLRVHDLRADQSLFTAKLPEDEYSNLIFNGEPSLYVFSRPREDAYGEWTIRRVDADEKSWEVTGTLPRGFIYGSQSGDVLRFFNRESEEEEPRETRLYELRNIEDGSVIASFPAGRGLLLSDGRFLEMEVGDTPVLRILGRDHAIEKTIELPARGRLTGASEPRPGLVALRMNPGRNYRDATTLLVDLETSEAQPLEQGLEVLSEGIRTGSKEIIIGDGRSIYLLDPETMQKTRIAGKG